MKPSRALYVAAGASLAFASMLSGTGQGGFAMFCLIVTLGSAIAFDMGEK